MMPDRKEMTCPFDEDVGTLDAIVNNAPPSFCNFPAPDEREEDQNNVISWMDEPFDRSYCSDLFGDFSHPHLQLLRDPFVYQSFKSSNNGRLGLPKTSIVDYINPTLPPPPTATTTRGGREEGSHSKEVTTVTTTRSGREGVSYSKEVNTITATRGAREETLHSKDVKTNTTAATTTTTTSGREETLHNKEFNTNTTATTTTDRIGREEAIVANPISGSSKEALMTMLMMEKKKRETAQVGVLSKDGSMINNRVSSRFNSSNRAGADAVMGPSIPPDNLTQTLLNSPAKPLDLAHNQQKGAGTVNFSYFSRAVAETKASLHMLSATTLTGIERVRQQQRPFSSEDGIAGVANRGEPSSSALSGRGSCIEGGSDHPQNTILPTIPPFDDHHIGVNVANLNHSSNKSAITGIEKPLESVGMPEVTMASPSRGSDNSTEKSVKEAVASVSLKRKITHVDEYEDQSEDVEEGDMERRKHASRSGSAKRTRAAEVHNESERRRRDRINEKMRALQQLIPNSNKTDKASMLDEAIEYLKYLQAQVQYMSMRSGINLGPLMMPMGMHNMQVQPLQHVGIGMGMGMGMGMGVGMGIMDVGLANAAAVRAMNPMMPGQVLPIPQQQHIPGYPPHPVVSNVTEGQEHLQPANVVNYYHTLIPHSHHPQWAQTQMQTQAQAQAQTPMQQQFQQQQRPHLPSVQPQPQ